MRDQNENQASLLFFDFVLTGFNPVFDQPVRFVAQRRSLEGQLLEELDFRIRLRRDVVPTLESLRGLGTPPAVWNDGVTEYESAFLIHQQFSRPGTTAIGFNAFGLDHEVSRFLCFRNLLDPAGLEGKGRRRGDLLPILVLFKVFAPDVLKFPVREDGTINFALRAVACENGLEVGDCSEAAEDVRLMVELMDLMKKGDGKLLYAALSRFSPHEDLQAIEKMKTVKARGRDVRTGILLSQRAHGKNYQLPAVLARTEKFGRQIWLLLESDLEAWLKGDTSQPPQVITRKPGEVPFVLRPEKGTITDDRRALIRKNLGIIGTNGVDIFLKGMKPEFGTYPNLDLDASLNEGQFGHELEESKDEIQRFHNGLGPEVRWMAVRNLAGERLRRLAERAFYRNFDCEQARRGREDFLRERVGGEARTVDHKGRERRTIRELQAEIDQLFEKGIPADEIDILRAIAEAYGLTVPEQKLEATSAAGEDRQENAMAEIQEKETVGVDVPETTGKGKKARKEKTKGRKSKKEKEEAPFGRCDCGEPYSQRLVLVVDSKCWNCDADMKVAMTGDCVQGGVIGSPENFSEAELAFAIEKGAIIRPCFSQTQQREYPANVCNSCNAMTGEFYLPGHSPGQMEMDSGVAPAVVFEVFGTECQRCLMEGPSGEKK